MRKVVTIIVNNAGGMNQKRGQFSFVSSEPIDNADLLAEALEAASNALVRGVFVRKDVNV